MLLLEQKYKPKTLYKDYKDDLLGQINTHRIRNAPLVNYKPKAFPIIHHPLNYLKPKAFKKEHTNVNIDNFKGHDLEPKHTNDLEEEVLKPILGVPDKDIPDAENIAHYQFKLEGKTDADVSLDNLTKEPTTLGNLIENAETGESIKTIKKIKKEPKNIETARANFIKMFKEKAKTKEMTPKEAVEGLGVAKQNLKAIEPIRTQRRAVKLKPVAPIKTPEVIPITSEDEPIPREKRTLTTQKNIAKMDVDESVIDEILTKVDRDVNVNKMIKSGDIDVGEFVKDLANAEPKTAIVMIKKLTIESLKPLLKNKKGLKTKAQYQDALYRELGIENPEIGSVMEKVGRIEKKEARNKKANV